MIAGIKTILRNPDPREGPCDPEADKRVLQNLAVKGGGILGIPGYGCRRYVHDLPPEAQGVARGREATPDRR